MILIYKLTLTKLTEDELKKILPQFQAGQLTLTYQTIASAKQAMKN